MSKISIPSSVEAQIRTRARNLPIYKCYVTKDWEKAQKASILISRKHTNGNITMCNFLVCLKLYGVKDCVYKFNESPLRLNEIIEKYHGQYEECDYHIAHNIVYAAWDFAAEYGFEPHKNFKTAQFILEEDSDDIPLIEIPLGDDGIPVLEIPYGETCQREITLLEKTAGANYHKIYLDKDGKPKPQKRTYAEALDEAKKIGFDDFMNKYAESDLFVDYQVITDAIYMLKVYSDEDKTQFNNVYDMIVKDQRLYMEGDINDQSEENHEKELALPVKYFEEGDADKAKVEFRKIIDKYPDNPFLWNVFLHNLAVINSVIDEKTVKEAYSRFPNHPYINVWYAEWLAQEKQYDEIFTLFHHTPGLDALTQEEVFINYSVLFSFCCAYAMAWLDKGDILHAEPYYQIIVFLELDDDLADAVQEKMVDLKRKKLTEMLNAGVFEKDDELDDK